MSSITNCQCFVNRLSSWFIQRAFINKNEKYEIRDAKKQDTSDDNDDDA